MHYTRLRLILAFVFIIIGIVLNLKFGIGSAWYLYFASSILIFTHFKFGTVWSAFSKLNEGKMDQADDLLAAIKRPDWLTTQARAYYYFTLGMIDLQKKELVTGENNLLKSIELGLRNDKDKALATLSLAYTCYQQNQPDKASKHLKKVKTFEFNDLMLQQRIQDLEKVLNS